VNEVLGSIHHLEVDGRLVDDRTLLVGESLLTDSTDATDLGEGQGHGHTALVPVLHLLCDGLGSRRLATDHDPVGGVLGADEVDEQLPELSELTDLGHGHVDDHDCVDDVVHVDLHRWCLGLTYRTWLSRFHGVLTFWLSEYVAQFPIRSHSHGLWVGSCAMSWPYGPFPNEG